MIVEEFFINIFGRDNTNKMFQCHTRHKISRINLQFYFKLLLTLCCIVGNNCEPLRGIKELQAALHEARVPPPFLGHCDFERPCKSWNYESGFKIISANYRKSPVGTPKADADENRSGN